jgi:hypothetical protein
MVGIVFADMTYTWGEIKRLELHCIPDNATIQTNRQFVRLGLEVTFEACSTPRSGGAIRDRGCNRER